ncbi:MAG: hypothetical protein IPO93_10890 [Actinobacteria bacterium]|nr:hypothetical protein [Actinomycetota bacterium]
MFGWARLALPLSAATVLVAAVSVPAFSAAPSGFDINGYIVGSWRNVDNGHVYAISRGGSAYEFRAGSAWKTAEGCEVTSGDLLFTLTPKQTEGGYLNGGDYVGPWRLLKKDASGACTWLAIAPGQSGYYEGTSGFVPTTGAKTAENPDGQTMNWFCAYTGPYTQCGTLSRIGPGFVQPSAKPTPTTTATPTTPTPTAKEPWPALPDALVALDSVSNGCGGGDASTEPKEFDTSTYYEGGETFVVNFRDACKIHDAGYSGAKVADPFHGGAVVDYFTWTRPAVDANFLEDILRICDLQVPSWATRALRECKGTGATTSIGALSRYNFVDDAGWAFYKDRPHLRGLWRARSHSDPSWAMVQDGRTVKALWRGGRGHSTLRGEFRGTIVSRDNDSAIQGFVRITEKGKPTISNQPMTMTWNPKKPKQIKVPAPAGPLTLSKE